MRRKTVEKENLIRKKEKKKGKENEKRRETCRIIDVKK